MYVSFLPNFDVLYNSAPNTAILGVHWSIGVEEQFYLLWPLLFLVNRKWFLPIVCSALVIFSEIFMINNQELKYHFLSSVRFLAWGSLCAWFCYHYLAQVKKALNLLSRASLAILYISMLSILFLHGELIEVWNPFKFLVEGSIFLLFTLVILEQNYSANSLIKMSRLKVFGWLGKISYGIYLLHMIGIYIMESLLSYFESNSFLLLLLGSLALTLLFSHLSFVYLESYFLRYKKRYSTGKPVQAKPYAKVRLLDSQM